VEDVSWIISNVIEQVYDMRELPIRANKEASGRQMSVKNMEVMEVIDLIKQQYTRRRITLLM